MLRRWDQPSAVSAATADGGAATAQPDRRGGGCRGKAWPHGVDVENDTGRLAASGVAARAAEARPYSGGDLTAPRGNAQETTRGREGRRSIAGSDVTRADATAATRSEEGPERE